MEAVQSCTLFPTEVIKQPQMYVNAFMKNGNEGQESTQEGETAQSMILCFKLKELKINELCTSYHIHTYVHMQHKALAEQQAGGFGGL